MTEEQRNERQGLEVYLREVVVPLTLLGEPLIHFLTGKPMTMRLVRVEEDAAAPVLPAENN